jgi:ribonuclease P protein component
MKPNSFTKNERLSSKRVIETLISKGIKVKQDNFQARVIYKTPENQDDTAILISVPKRSFKLAVSRNRIKRLIREVYRKNKSLITSRVQYLHISYYGSNIPDYQEVERSLLYLFRKIC